MGYERGQQQIELERLRHRKAMLFQEAFEVLLGTLFTMEANTIVTWKLAWAVLLGQHVILLGLLDPNSRAQCQPAGKGEFPPQSNHRSFDTPSSRGLFCSPRLIQEHPSRIDEELHATVLDNWRCEPVNERAPHLVEAFEISEITATLV